MALFGPKWVTEASVDILLPSRTTSIVVPDITKDAIGEVPVYFLMGLMGSVRLLRNFTGNCKRVSAEGFEHLKIKFTDSEDMVTYNGDLSGVLGAPSGIEVTASVSEAPRFHIMLQTRKGMVVADSRIPMRGDQDHMHRQAIGALLEWTRLTSVPNGNAVCAAAVTMFARMAVQGRDDYSADMLLGFAAAKGGWERANGSGI